MVAVAPPIAPADAVRSRVVDPTAPSNRRNDTTEGPVISGIHGETLVGEVGHGRYYNATKRGNLFLGNTVIAGVALPVNAATLVSKFTLYNPAGSTADVELVEFGLGLDSATEVVNGLVAGVQTNVSTTGGGVPGTLTQLTTPAMTYGFGRANLPQAALYSAATLTNAAALTNLIALGMNFDATAAGFRGAGVYPFDGKLVLPPDTLVTFISTVAAITAAFCSLVWAEWPR